MYVGQQYDTGVIIHNLIQYILISRNNNKWHAICMGVKKPQKSQKINVFVLNDGYSSCSYNEWHPYGDGGYVWLIIN